MESDNKDIYFGGNILVLGHLSSKLCVFKKCNQSPFGQTIIKNRVLFYNKTAPKVSIEFGSELAN